MRGRGFDPPISVWVVWALLSASTSPALATPGAAPPPVAVRASEQWQIIENRTGCSLRAEVAGGQKVRAVVLTPDFGTASIGSAQLELVPGVLPDMFNVGLKIGDAEPRISLGVPSQDSAGLRTGIRTEDAELREMERGTIVLAAVPGETVAFSTSHAVPMLIRLGQCDQRVLETALGGSIPKAATPARSKSPIFGIFSSADYPREALARNQQGLTAVILRIGINGRVTECLVAESSGTESLDKATCEILRRRTKYSPARDASGGPVPGIDRARIRWLLPTMSPLTKPKR